MELLDELVVIANATTTTPDSRPAWLRSLHEAPADQTLYYRFLYDIACRLRPRTVLETGTRSGFSAAQFAAGSPEGKDVTIDINPASKRWMGQFADLKRFKNIVPIIGDSLAVKKKVLEHVSEVDLLFLDSVHEYRVVSGEFRLYGPLLKKGGVLVMDDIRLNDEMEKFWGEIPWPKAEVNHLHRVYNAGFGIAVKNA